jgi:hypothetical protein
MPLRVLIYGMEQPLISIVALLALLLELNKIHSNTIEWLCSYILRCTPADELVKLCLDANLAIFPRR